MRAPSVVCSVLLALVAVAPASAQTGATPPAPPAPPPAAETPATPPAVETPPTETPATAPPAAETPAAETPAAETPPAIEAPADKDDSEEASEEDSEEDPAGEEPRVAPDAPECGPRAIACLKNDLFAVWPRLRLRTGYEYVQPDEEVLSVGQNDGFYVDQARAGVDVAFKQDWRFRAIFEAFNVPGQVANAPVLVMSAAARDLWVAYAPMPWFSLTVGQQFMPVDLEGSQTTAGLPFARRSVAIAGVRAGHGYVVSGLSPTRQLGIVVGSREDASIGPVSLEYKFAVANGNGQNILGNDNKLPALYGRVGAGFLDLVKVGVHARFNPRTVGTPPNLYTESDLIAGADLVVELLGFQAVGQVVHRETSFVTVVPDPTNPLGKETGLGVTAWLWAQNPLGFSLFGFSPAYRISYFDPSSAFLTDQLLENSIGVRWDLPVDELPMALFVDGTILTEMGEGARDLSNNRFTALLQVDL